MNIRDEAATFLLEQGDPVSLQALQQLPSPKALNEDNVISRFRAIGEQVLNHPDRWEEAVRQNYPGRDHYLSQAAIHYRDGQYPSWLLREFQNELDQGDCPFWIQAAPKPMHSISWEKIVIHMDLWPRVCVWLEQLEDDRQIDYIYQLQHAPKVYLNTAGQLLLKWLENCKNPFEKDGRWNGFRYWGAANDFLLAWLDRGEAPIKTLGDCLERIWSIASSGAVPNIYFFTYTHTISKLVELLKRTERFLLILSTFRMPPEPVPYDELPEIDHHDPLFRDWCELLGYPLPHAPTDRRELLQQLLWEEVVDHLTMEELDWQREWWMQEQCIERAWLRREPSLCDRIKVLFFELPLEHPKHYRVWMRMAEHAPDLVFTELKRRWASNQDPRLLEEAELWVVWTGLLQPTIARWLWEVRLQSG